MSISEEELKIRYDALSDQELLKLWDKNTLTETAQSVLKAELQSRGIVPPPTLDIKPDQLEDDDDGTAFKGPWVTVAQFSTGPEAHIVRARLESEDIPAIVADEHLITANWFLSNALGGVRVRVPHTYAEQAFSIIKELESGNLEISDGDVQVRLCPKCEADDVVEYKRSWKISFLILYLLHIPVPYNSNEYKCKKCGNIWKEKPENSPNSGQNTPSADS